MSKIEVYETQLGDISNTQSFYLPKDLNWHIKLNSPGGSLTSTTYLIDRMLKHKHKVITENVGNCQSAAFHIFAAGQERLSYEYAVFMFHSGNLGGGSDLNSTLEFATKFSIQNTFLNKRLEKISTKSFKYWNDLHQSDKDYFFTARELKKLGIVTKII